MSQIPETGLGRTPRRVVACYLDLREIGMSQIPETGLGQIDVVDNAFLGAARSE